jgi:hypothetical protein
MQTPVQLMIIVVAVVIQMMMMIAKKRYYSLMLQRRISAYSSHPMVFPNRVQVVSTCEKCFMLNKEHSLVVLAKHRS